MIEEKPTARRRKKTKNENKNDKWKKKMLIIFYINCNSTEQWRFCTATRMSLITHSNSICLKITSHIGNSNQSNAMLFIFKSLFRSIIHLFIPWIYINGKYRKRRQENQQYTCRHVNYWIAQIHFVDEIRLSSVDVYYFPCQQIDVIWTVKEN